MPLVGLLPWFLTPFQGVSFFGVPFAGASPGLVEFVGRVFGTGLSENSLLPNLSNKPGTQWEINR